MAHTVAERYQLQAFAKKQMRKLSDLSADSVIKANDILSIGFDDESEPIFVEILEYQNKEVVFINLQVDQVPHYHCFIIISRGTDRNSVCMEHLKPYHRPLNSIKDYNGNEMIVLRHAIVGMLDN